MADRGIFVKVLASLEAATFMTAIEQLRAAASTAGKDVGKSWDSAAAISAKAGDQVIKTEAAVQAATEKRIVVEDNLQRAKIKTAEVAQSTLNADLKAERELEAAELNLAKVRASVHTDRIAQLNKEVDAKVAAAAKEQDTAKAEAAFEVALAKETLAKKLAAQDEYNAKAAANRMATAQAGAAATNDAPLLGAVAAEDAARRNATKSLADQNAALAAHTGAVDAAAAAQVTSTQKAAAAVTAFGKGSAIALLAIGGVSAHIASQVEQNMNRLIVMHQEGASSVGKMTQQVYELANQVPFSVQKLSEGLQLIEQHGYRGQDAMNVLNASAKTALATHAELGDTIGGLTTQLDDMGYQGEKGPQLLKDMNTMAGQLVVTMKDLKNLNPGEYFRALHSVEPSASAYMSGMPGNVRSAQISAMMDTLSQTGMTQEQSAPNLARMISVLGAVKPGSPTFNALGQLDLKQADIAGEMRTQGPIEVIKTIQDAIGARTDKKTGLVNMGWQYNNPQVDQLIAETKAGLSAGGQNFLANHPNIEKGVEKTNVLKGDLGKSDLSGQESGDILTLSQWEAMKNSPQSFIKKGGTADLTPGQVYQMLFGTGDVARTGLILGQDPEATKKRADNVQKEGENPATLQDAFNQAMKSTTNQWKQLSTTTGSLLGRLGNDLLPVVKAVVSGFTGMLDFFGKHTAIGATLLYAMGAVAGVAGFMKILTIIENFRGGITRIVDGMASIIGKVTGFGNSAATAGGTLTAGATTAATEVEGGATKLATAETTAGTTLQTGATTAAAEMEAGAAKLAASEATAGTTLTVASTTAGTTLETAAASTAARLALGAAGWVAALAAASVAISDWFNNWSDSHPEVQRRDQYGHKIPGREAGGGAGYKGPLEDLQQPPGSLDPRTIAGIHGDWTAVPGATSPTPTPPPPDATSDPGALPDHSAETGTGDVASSGPTATGPNVQSQVKFHPIDLNPADMPANKTYDDWISDQKGVQSALNAVDSSATALAVAQSKMAELTKKGTASQEAWNSASDALVKAKVDNQDAVQNATIAQQKLAANSKKSGLGNEYDPFSGMSGGFTLPNIAKLLGTFLAEEALGNPYGKLQAAKLGADASNPMFTQDVNGAINSNALASQGITQNADGSYTTTSGSGTGAYSAVASPGGNKQQIANMIISSAKARGLSDKDALGLVAYSIGESGLDPGISGGKQGDDEVMGLFQEKTAFSGGHDTAWRANPQNNINAYLDRYQQTGGQDVEHHLYNTSIGGPFFTGGYDAMRPLEAQAQGYLNNYNTSQSGAPATQPGGAPAPAAAGTPNLIDALKGLLLPHGGPGGFGQSPVLGGPPPTPSDVHYVPGQGFMNDKGQHTDSFGRVQGNSPTKLDEATLRGADMKDWQYNHPGGASAPGGKPPGTGGSPGGDAGTFGNVGMPPGTPGSQAPAPGQRPPPSQGGLPGAERERKGKGNDPSAAAPWRATGPASDPIKQQQFGTGASQQGVTGGGGAGPGGGGSLLGMAESAAALAAGPAAPAAGIAMQEANRLAGYVGQLAGIGAEGLLETFSLSGENFDPSSTLAGKLVTGLAGAKGSGGPNAAGKTAPPLKGDDKKNQQQQQGGDGQNPGVNIGTQNFYGDAQAQANAATKSINTANMMYGGQMP